MNIISWNVNGLRALHRKGLFGSILDLEPDIICLQETKSSPEQLPQELRSLIGFHSFFNSSKIRKGYSGTAIYSKEKPLDVFYGIDKNDDPEGRIVGLEYKDFFLLNVYFPNGGGGPERLAYKLTFYNHFLDFIESLRSKKPVIFCGDINTAHTEIDLARPKENEKNTGFLPKERAWIDRVISKGYVDIFRYLNPHVKEAYTYWDMKTFARTRNVGWRIDYFFVDKTIVDKVEGSCIYNEMQGSDHCPIGLNIL